MDLDAIRNCVESAQEALDQDNAGDYSNYNQSFHYEIWKASGNEKLKNMLSELWNGLSMGVKSTAQEYATKSLTEHKEILEALEKRDRDLARKRMHRHIIRSMEDVLTRYR